MLIVFENIESGEKRALDSNSMGAQNVRAHANAFINSSNLSKNATRGQDFGWRLVAEQMAIVEKWRQDPAKLKEISDTSGIMIDNLTVGDIVGHLIYEAELEDKVVEAQLNSKPEAQAEYEKRVKAIVEGKPLETPEVKPVQTPVQTTEKPVQTTTKKK